MVYNINNIFKSISGGLQDPEKTKFVGNPIFVVIAILVIFIIFLIIAFMVACRENKWQYFFILMLLGTFSIIGTVFISEFYRKQKTNKNQFYGGKNNYNLPPDIYFNDEYESNKYESKKYEAPKEEINPLSELFSNT